MKTVTFLKRCLLSSLLVFGSYKGMSQPNSSTPTAAESNQQFTPAQLQADLKVMRTILEESHPGFYRYTPKARFDVLFDSIHQTLNRPMTQQEFYVAATPLIVALKDGHVKYMPHERPHWQYYYNLDKLFPLDLYFPGKEAYLVRNNAGSDNIPLGSEIIAINGEPIKNLIDKLLPTVYFADGNSQAVKYLSLTKFFPFYYGTYVGGSGTYEITYREKNNPEVKTVSIPAIDLATIQKLEKEDQPAPRLPMRLQYKENSTAILTIDNFNVYKDQMDVKKFYRDTFWQLNAKNIQNLIIDVRGNEGGIDKWGALLYSYLSDKPFRYYDEIRVAQKKKFSFTEHIAWVPKMFPVYRRFLIRKSKDGMYTFPFKKLLKTQKPQSHPFKGDVYILTDGYSFSVTSEFAAIAHSNNRATFIGRETGGGYYGNTSGFFVVAVLPNTKIELATPQWGYYMAVEDYPYPDRGILPDHEVIPTIEDILQKHDADLELTLDLIRKKKSASATKN
ncbi:S41 family peptidase [Adhaeribacter radiodurans]|uniref:Peptidase S41 n=1 Tax=Adhaeribacter radiodurans TaxID=2745197 RepID=A0A7L7L786_9BACT|nr:S41 family peptidase [Adhaeribacter radiodurans]QMU28633.1 peptidase S41 [Adhaeribacter radiodurans]